MQTKTLEIADDDGDLMEHSIDGDIEVDINNIIE